MNGGVITFFEILLIGAMVISGTILAVWLLSKGVKGLMWALTNGAKGIGALIRHIFCFVRSMLSDSLRGVGALVTALVLIPLAVLNLLFFRWAMCKHYLHAVEDEVMSFGLCIYRLALGNPMRLVGMTAITDGIERRIPDVVARAPRNSATAANVRDGKFEGYKVTGVLPAGGSGARLFLAKPRPQKLAEILATGYPDPGQVVIKAFSLSTGSTMPQIVRESRALESARKLGLILEHELTDKSFHYVMPYVPGNGLDQVITAMHTSSGERGLSDKQLRVALGYVGDVLFTLDAFHSGGLWHKDIKPSNLIVCEGRAHLVDLGLVTPLASAMTLTTHGTEYYRDPEMVRLALRGVKVAEVDGAKFDIYSTGAVLFSLMENSFPAQGSLSQLTRRAPDVINWIIRRAMADMDSRYNSVTEMLADVRTVLAAPDPYKVRPADLPSVNGRMDKGVPRASFADINTAPANAASNKAGRAFSNASSARANAAHANHTGTATKVARRSTGRSLAISGVGFLFLLGIGFAIVEGERGSGSRYSSGPSFDKDPAAWCELNVSEFVAAAPSASAHAGTSQREAKLDPAEVIREASKQLKNITRKWNRQLRKQLNAVRSEAKKKNTDLLNSGTVLILQDLDKLEFGSWLEGLKNELERREFDLVGSLTGKHEDERDILFEAGARRAIGVSSADDPDARYRLQEYINQSDGIDAIIWLETGSSEGSLRYQVIRPGAPQVFVGEPVIVDQEFITHGDGN